MQIRIITENPIRNKDYLEAVREFEKRLTPFTKICLLPFHYYIPEQKEAVIEIRSFGATISSEQFAGNLQQFMTDGISSLTFSLTPLSRQDSYMCISHMHMSEALTACVLYEQIYRAFMIINNRTYHK